MPREKIEDIKPEDIDASVKDRAKETYHEGIAPVVGALGGVGVGLGVSRMINTFAAGQPEANRDWAHYGLKGVAILGALVEMGLSTTMDRTNKKGNPSRARQAALVGGATFIATETIEIIQDAATQKAWKIPFLMAKNGCGCDGKTPMPPAPTGIQRQQPNNPTTPNFKNMAQVPL
jgi:hypothetical protein